jgi:hypothetical protein
MSCLCMGVRTIARIAGQSELMERVIWRTSIPDPCTLEFVQSA